MKDEAQENHTQGPDRFAGINSSLPASESSRKTNKVTETPRISLEDKEMWRQMGKQSNPTHTALDFVSAEEINY